MPKFILCHGSAESAQAFNALDAFTRGYIEAAFFTCDFENAYTCELAPSALAEIIVDCTAWQAKAAKLLDVAYDHCDYKAEQAGRDYWFTRNGHGVGFWDRKQLERPLYYNRPENKFELGDDSTAHWEGAQPLGSLGDALSKLAEKAGGVDMYRGDDDSIYFG
jgi:hypothetical protein